MVLNGNNLDLYNSLMDGKVKPTDYIEVEAWDNGNEIALVGNFNYDDGDIGYIMAWKYYQEVPVFLTECSLSDRVLKFSFNDEILETLKNDNLKSVRLSYIIQRKEGYQCGYFKKANRMENLECNINVTHISENGKNDILIFWNNAHYLGIKRQLNDKLMLSSKINKYCLENKKLLDESNRYLYELTETRNSRTYRLVQKMVYLPRKIYKFKERLANVQEKYSYMVSAVIAVYNTELYLEELLDSIIEQKKDLLVEYLKHSSKNNCVFKDLCEVILVDDGATDASGKICDDYAKKYSWIKVIHKKNGGVSSARNAGIMAASGKYITFPDSDDKLDKNVFEKCLMFFEEHQNEISYVAYPHIFFEGATGKHWTGYRFDKGTRIVDLLEEYNQPQYFTNACFFKTDDIKGKIEFDTNLINGEDTVFANDVVFGGSHKIGLVSDCVYWYRRRTAGELSAIQESKKTEKYYLPYCTDVLGRLMASAERKYGYVPRYIQYTVMGQIQWRLRSDPDGSIAKSVVGENGFIAYKDALKGLIKKIDSDIIAEQKNMYREHKYYAACIKNNGQLDKVYDFENMNLKYYCDGNFITEAAGCYIKLEFMRIKNGHLQLEGRISNFEAGVETWVEYQIAGKKYKASFVIKDDESLTGKILNEPALDVRIFTVDLPIDNISENANLCFYSSINGYIIKRRAVNLGKFMPISRVFSYSYYLGEKWYVLKENNMLKVINSNSSYIDFEKRFEEQIRKSITCDDENLKYALEIRREAKKRISEKKKNNNSSKLWLISDRYHVADDNGEAFFRFLSGINDTDIEYYFVIDKDSKDYNSLKKYGKVVAQDSREHHILHMIADCIISSQGDEYIWDPFWRMGNSREIFKDFYSNHNFIFLQHGVTKDNLSSWLNKYNKNIKGFVVSAKKEAKSILEYDYYYDKSNVWLTGMPRFDRLYHNEKKHILIMPTWRKWLMKDFDSAKSDKDAVHVSDNIERTEFFEFYTSLINSKKLLDAADMYGYKICFMPHTNFREVLDKFVVDSRVVPYDFDMKYRDAFAQADLLVTDYSSTPFDFAYLKKPVVYAQFDKEKFFGGSHTYSKGYFDYEKNGFGEVTYNREDLIDLIIDYMKNECALKEKYSKRINKFYNQVDNNNCLRVYNKLKELC